MRSKYNLWFLLLLIFSQIGSIAQVKQSFEKRFKENVNGDILMIGNNIINRKKNVYNPNDAYPQGGESTLCSGTFFNYTCTNADYSMENIDVDGDASTINSSSATLSIPGGFTKCKSIKYAILYWSAILQQNDRTDIEKVKIKLPGKTSYLAIVGNKVYDKPADPIGDEKNKVYVCSYDLTKELKALTTPEGVYTVGNIKTSTGLNGGTGLSAGWSLFIVYEDPALSAKNITTFDGFAGINDGDPDLIIPIDGFTTIPAGPVNSKFAFAALEGDRSIINDQLLIDGKEMSTINRPSNNFFNSTITSGNAILGGRTPNSSNTLGYDMGIFDQTDVLKNNQTQTKVTLTTKGDVYFYFFNAFSVEIIQPKIVLTKTIRDLDKNTVLANGSVVGLNTKLRYTIGLQNIGNDHVQGLAGQPSPYGTNYILLTDNLPVNVTLNNIKAPTDFIKGLDYYIDPVPINPLLPATGANVDPSKIRIYIDKFWFVQGRPKIEFYFDVTVAPTCEALVDACSENIDNIARVAYRGDINLDPITNDSFSSYDATCKVGIATATNVLGDRGTCKFIQDILTCKSTTTLTAGKNYNSYLWTGPPGAIFTPNNTSQTVTVNMTGTYTVDGTSATCKPIKQTFNVKNTATTIANPIIPYEENVKPVICNDAGGQIPYIYLCSASDSQLIDTNITNATVDWYLYNEAGVGCGPYDPVSNCPVTTASCWGSSIFTGTSYTVTTAGKYRIKITFPDPTCPPIYYYFNVQKNNIAPVIKSKDIICGKQGYISITGITGFEYQVKNGATLVADWNPITTIFSTTTPANYTIILRPIGFTSFCPITNPTVKIDKFDADIIPTIVQPFCSGANGSTIPNSDKGKVTIAIGGGVPGQYYYSVTGPSNQSIGPTNASSNVFILGPGTYNWEAHTDDGCSKSGTFDIIAPSPISLKTTILKELTNCNDGQIKVEVTSGGTAPYTFYLAPNLPPLSAPLLSVGNYAAVPAATAGSYTFEVYDKNNCKATITQVINKILPPVFTIDTKNILCYGDKTGEINFKVTNNNGNSLEYSIDGGLTYSLSPNFTGLSAGITYKPIIRYTINGTSCTLTQPDIILTQPTAALTATGGVMSIACAPSGNGIIRITNVQGGTPFPGTPPYYEYKFNAGWTTTNQATVPPGTYTIYVRDANGCQFPMTVTLDPIPAQPNISDPVTIYNCDGTANSTITVTPDPTSSAAYNLTYSITPALTPAHNPTSNVFQNVPCGNSTITVNYTLVNPPTYSNLLKEDFGSGADGPSPGASPNFCRKIQGDVNSCTKGKLGLFWGEYVVTSELHKASYPGWLPFPTDHTGNPGGRFFATDMGGPAPKDGGIQVNDIFYKKRINDIIPNQQIIVEVWIRNMGHLNQTLPEINLTLDTLGGVILSTTSTGPVPENGIWNKYTVSLNPGANTSLDFSCRIANPGVAGRDFALDDISVYQLPIACTTTRTFPINIPCGKAFTAKITGHKDVSCAGVNDAYVTVDAQNFDPTKGFQVSMNNGTSWTTYMTSPQNVPVPATGYTGVVLVRFDSSTTSTSPCYKTLNQTIIVPTQLTNVASIKTAPTCLTGATLQAIVAGGTAPYQYQLEFSTGGPAIVPYQTGSNTPPYSHQFTNVAAGSYIIRVKDANGCILPSNVVVVGVSPKPTLNIVSTSCYNGTSATIVVNATDGTPAYQYSIDGGAFSAIIPAGTNYPFTVNTPKAYDIVVRDANGCMDTKKVTINGQLTATAVMKKDIDCTASPNGVIQVTINNGNPGYSYQVRINGGAFTPVVATPTATPFTYTVPATITAAISYEFQITDSKGCTTITNKITVNPLGTILANINSTNITCNGLNDGIVTFAPSGGVSPYEINFNNLGFSNTFSYNNLSPNIAYPYVIRDAKQCTIPGTVTLSQPAPLTATAALTNDFTCNGPGEITVTVTSAGTAGVGYPRFSITGGSTWTTNPVIGSLNPGTYTVLVEDANKCRFTITPNIVVTPLNRPTALTITPRTTLQCPAKTINVQVAATGGFGTLTYAITAPAASAQTSATGTFNNLAPGTYTFEVTDSKNCKYSTEYTINDLAPVTATSVVKANVKCKGDANGSAEITVGGFGTDYDYTVVGPTPSTGNSFSSPLVLTNLLAGSYTVTITNTTTKCPVTTNFNITEPAVALDATLTPNAVTCTTNTGSITVNATGGWGGYTYAISPVAGNLSGNVFSNLPANTYTITITDANGCAIQRTLPLTAPATPSIAIDAASDYCYDTINGATIIVNGSGGVPNYQYSITPGGVFGGTNTFANLTPGTYTFTVKDALGCTASITETIAKQLNATAVLTKTYDCTASPDAVITVSIFDGYPNYTSYRVRYNGGAWGATTPIAVGATSFTYTVLVANPGTYEFEITDAKGCTTTTQIIVAPRSLPVLTVNPLTQNLKCFGDATGSVTWSVAGGTPNYTINVVNITTGTNYGSQTSGLPAGNYTITVTDSKSCTDTKTFTITQPDEIKYTPDIKSLTCDTSNTGSEYSKGSICIKTDLVGGTLPITFVLKDANGVPVGAPIVVNSLPLATPLCFPNIDYGVYSVTATDANLCSKVATNLIMSSPVSALTFTYIATPTCSNAMLQVDITGGVIGTGNYEFGIVDQVGFPFSSQFYSPNNGPSSMIFSSSLVPPLPVPIVPGGNYTIVVRDLKTKCYHFQNAPIPTTSINPTVNVTPVPVTCNGNNDGKLEISISNLSTGVSQISYQVFYEASNTAVGPATVVNAPFAFPYVVTGLKPGNYNIFIIELDGANAGCGKTFGIFEIKESATPLTLTATATNDNCNLNAGTVIGAAAGGTGPYLYQIFADTGVVGVIDASDPVINATFSASFNPATHTASLFNVEGGNYIVYTKDAYGCIVAAFTSVATDPTPVVAAALNGVCNAEGNFVIDVTLPTAGIDPHSFSLTKDGVPGPFVTNTPPFSYTGLTSGTYTVTVKDKNGCGNTTAPITILKPLSVTASFTKLPTCNNADGTIRAIASDGSGNYEFRLVPAAFQAPNVNATTHNFGSLAPGNYTIEVRDTTTGCIVTKTVNLDNAIPVGVSLAQTAVKCIGDANGSITVNLNANQTDVTYQYQITAAPPAYTGALPSALQTSNVFAGLPAGNYTIAVISGRGCPGSASIIVDSPQLLTGNYTLPAPTLYTCTNNLYNSIAVTINATGGTGPGTYTYSFNGGGYTTSNTFNIEASTTAVTNFTYSIKDANGCPFDGNGSIPQIVPLTAPITQFQKIDCKNNEIITINASGGHPGTTYTYTALTTTNVTAGPGANQFTISAPGTYFFRVIDNLTDCWVETAAYVIPVFNNLSATLQNNANVSCNTSTSTIPDGSLALNVSGYSGPYHYTVINTTTNTPVPGFINIAANTTINNPLIISGLGAGSYTVTVVEDNYPQCDFITPIAVITQPSLLVVTPKVIKNDNNCTNPGGRIQIDASGGNNTTYTYQLLTFGSAAPTAASTGWVSTNTFAVEYSAGSPNYTAYLKDANGCIQSANITLPLDPDPTVTLAPLAKDQCTVPTTTYTFTVTNVTGVGPFTYSTDGVLFNPVTTVPFDITVPVPNVPTNYTVTIKDANGCKPLISPFITIYPPLSLGNKIDTLTSCTNGDGQVTVSANGGSGNYTYSIAPPVGPPNTNGIFTGLSHAIPYTFTVEDNTTRCTTTTSVTIPVPTNPILNNLPVTKAVSCFGGSDGTITVNLATVGNNEPPYTYALIFPSQQLVPAQPNNVFTGLQAGNYTVEVTSGRGCKTTAVVTVSQPAIIVVDPPQVSQYQCTPGTNVNKNATITVNRVLGGSNNYVKYDFILGGVMVQSGPSNTYTELNLLGGTYTINVYDDKNCMGSTTAIINPFIGISDPVITVNNKITCVSNEDITVSVTTTGGPPAAYNFSIDKIPTTAGFPIAINGASTGAFTGLAIGDYMVTVTNPVTGCSVQKIHYVQNPNTFTLSATNPTDVKCFNANDGTVVLSISDYNTPPNDATGFNYTITNNTTPLVINGTSTTATSPTISGLTAGSYTVTATLINDPLLTNNTQCTVTTNFTIGGPQDRLILSTKIKSITCKPGNDGIIVASATGGWGDYTYSINPLATQLSIGTFIGLKPIKYTITVTDKGGKGCSETSVIDMTVPPAIKADPLNDITLKCFGVNDGTISVTNVTGGDGLNNYTYILNQVSPDKSTSAAQTSPTFSNLGVGSYSIIINDSFGCNAKLDFNVIGTTEVSANLSLKSQNCDTSNSILELRATGGNGTYFYNDGVKGWIPFNSPLTLNNITPGDYTYSVRDGNSCTPYVVKITVPTLPTLKLDAIKDQSVTCSNSLVELITVKATGGKGNYTYYLIDQLTNVIVQTNKDGEFKNVPVGDYRVEVSSASDCTRAFTTFKITSPVAFTYEVFPFKTICSNTDSGYIKVIVKGVANRNIQYLLWSNDGTYDGKAAYDTTLQVDPKTNDTFFIVNNLKGAMDYEVFVYTTPGNCSPGKVQFRIDYADAVTYSYKVINEVCNDENKGSIIISDLKGGTGPYRISYTSTSTITSSGSANVSIADAIKGHTFKNLDGGDYKVMVKDTLGCEFPISLRIDKGDSLDSKIENLLDCVNNKPTYFISVKNSFDPLNIYFPIGTSIQLYQGIQPSIIPVNPAITVTSANQNVIFDSNTYPAVGNGGNFTLIIKGPKGCSKTVATPQPIVPLLPLEVTLSQSGLNTALAVATGGTGDYTYEFYADGQLMQSGPEDTFIYTQQYNLIKVVVTDSSGCNATNSKRLIYIPIQIPDVITPDGNGQNDDWGPDFVDPTVYPRLVTKVYDRYGRLLATLPVGARWNGKYDGKELPSGDYWYVIKVDNNDGQEFVGHFTLYR